MTPDLPTTGTPSSDVGSHLRLLFRPGDVFEVRAPKCRERAGMEFMSTRSGYYTHDAIDKAAADIGELDATGLAPGIYVTMNPVNPALLARAHNRLIKKAGSTTADTDIVARRWFFVDCDPVRPAGTSTTDAELAAAAVRAREIRVHLASLDWPDPIESMSGNGHHLTYKIDLPADDGGLIQRVLQSLAARFNDDKVKIDTSVGNAARITKIVGTMARKGDDFQGGPGIEARPHRRSRLLSVPEPVRVVPLALLEAHCAQPIILLTVPAYAPSRLPVSRPAYEDVPATPDGVMSYLKKHGVVVSRVRMKNAATFLDLELCPVSGVEAAGNEVSVIVTGDGGVFYKNHHNRGAGITWSDVRDKLEPGFKAARGASVTSVGSVAQVPLESWPKPKPLPDSLPAVMAFDPELLPDALRAWIVDIAERTQCPIDFPAVSAMVVLASLVGRKVGIRPKRHDDWLVVPNLWGAVIGRPGVMKTPAIQHPLKPLNHLEMLAKDVYDQQMEDARAAQLVAKVRSKETERRVKGAIKNPDAALELAREALKEDNGDEPVRKRYVINDSSVEKLGEILNENPHGILVFRDELIGLLKSLDKEGNEGARSFYLEAWNGTGQFTYDRIGRGTIDIPAAIVSVMGGIQPGVLGQYLRAASREGKFDDGLIQRFQLLVWPDVSRDWRNVDRWPDTPARERAHAVIKSLDKLQPDLLGVDRDPLELDAIPYLRFNDKAQEEFDRWRLELEQEVRSGDLHPAMESHLAKFRSLIPSLALIMHLADGHSGPVEAGSLRRAVAWGEYLDSHANRVYSNVVRGDVFAARELAKKILAGEVENGFTLRSIYRRGWTGLGNTEDAKAAADYLSDLDWLREVRNFTPGRTGSVYLINPLLGIAGTKLEPNASNSADTGDRSPSQSGPEISRPPSDRGDRTDTSSGAPPSVASVSDVTWGPPDSCVVNGGDADGEEEATWGG